MNVQEAREGLQSKGLVGKRMAIVDDNDLPLEMFSEVYRAIGLVVVPYKYPEKVDTFWEECSTFDFILIDHRLGGTNGANVAANLLKTPGVDAEIFLITGELRDDYKEFKYYYDKQALVDNPLKIFDVQDDVIERAVETSVLMQVEVGG